MVAAMDAGGLAPGPVGAIVARHPGAGTPGRGLGVGIAAVAAIARHLAAIAPLLARTGGHAPGRALLPVTAPRRGGRLRLGVIDLDHDHQPFALSSEQSRVIV